jgi:type II secretory pathway component PulC
MRYGDQPSEYKSGCLFECVILTDMDLFCLMNGLELNEHEEKRLFEILCSMAKAKLTMKDFQRCGSNLVLGKGNVMFKDIF